MESRPILDRPGFVFRYGRTPMGRGRGGCSRSISALHRKQALNDRTVPSLTEIPILTSKPSIRNLLPGASPSIFTPASLLS
jgi:hypothetical protein